MILETGLLPKNKNETLLMCYALPVRFSALKLLVACSSAWTPARSVYWTEEQDSPHPLWETLAFLIAFDAFLRKLKHPLPT